jgi:4-hydroxybenzoate polyprenyltransferase
MGADQVHAVSGLRARVVVFGRMIRFSHSVFALPFALSGVLFAAHVYGEFPGINIWFWVAIAMVGARSAAMALNRIVDHRIDAANPRTRDREIPRGVMSLGTAWLFTAVSVLVFLLACWNLNSLALALSPLALAIVFFYSFTKRFTWTTHLFLGLALAVAPVGGWVAVTGRLDWAPFLLGAAVLAWVAGFDVFYALQDLEFDRGHGIRSIPARFGVAGAIRAARILHLLMVLVLASLTWIFNLSVWYLVGVGVIALVLLYEHRLVKPDDLSKLDKAFFDMNAVVSMLYLGSSAVGVFL